MCVQREGLLGEACVCDIKCEVVGVQSALLDLLALGKRRPIESRLPLLSLLVPSLLLLCMQVRARVHYVKLGGFFLAVEIFISCRPQWVSQETESGETG